MTGARVKVGDRVRVSPVAAPFGVVKFVRIHGPTASTSGGKDVAIPAAAIAGVADGVITLDAERLPAETRATLTSPLGVAR